MPKATEVGESVAIGATAVPERDTVWGLPAALSETERVAVRTPVADGVKVMLMLQLAPTANVAPQVVVRAKLEEFVPKIEMLLIVMAPAPVLVSTTTLAALVVFTN